jgi:peptidoglycan/xylan/chitin deacetylase (PgdA/CDA1 family)
MSPPRSHISLAARRIRGALGGTVVVLTYHRVADLPFDPERLAVSPETFTEHVAAFAGRYELMSAAELLRTLVKRRRLPRRGLVVTFDDGYADTLGEALPILKAHDMPATVFVSTACLEPAHEFWWDKLERLAFCAELPAVLRLTTAATPACQGQLNKPCNMEFGLAGEEIAPSIESLLGWDVTKPAQTGRQRMYVELASLLRPASLAERSRLLGELQEQAESDTGRLETLTLSETQLMDLAADGTIEIGAHTVHHPWLAALTPFDQTEEICRAKETLESLTGAPPVSFSYPYGTSDSFTAATKEIVRRAGFAGAFTTELGAALPWGSVSFDSDRFLLSRMPTADVPAAKLVPLIDARLGL